MIITEIQEILVNLRERLKPSRQKRQQLVVKTNDPEGQLISEEKWPLFKAAIKRI
jgi:hypothetical protein